MKRSCIRHEGPGVTKGEPPGPKGVADGVQGAAASVPVVAVIVQLVAVDDTGVLVALVVALEEEVGALDVTPPALVTVAVAFSAAATVVDIVKKQLKKIKLLQIFNV